jgi:hypothetical protein
MNFITNKDILNMAKGGETMFGKPQEQPKEEPKAEIKVAQDSHAELKALLLADTNGEDAGILQLAKRQFTGDLQHNKIARAIELLNAL